MSGKIRSILRKSRIPAAVVGALLLLYTIAGFLIAPTMARSYAVDHLRETYGLDLRIAKLRFNPFTLLARVDGLELDAADGQRLLSFEQLQVNLGWRSLYERAVVFQSILLAEPFVHVHLREDGTLNLAAAFAGADETEDDGQAASGDESSAPAIVVDDFLLARGALRFTDNQDGRDFDQRFAPLDLRLQQFSTRPRAPSDLVAFVINFGEHGRLAVSGMLSAEPAAFDLDLVAQDIPLALFQPYVPPTLAADIAGGVLSFTLDAAHGLSQQESALALRGTAGIAGLGVQVADREETVLAWTRLDLNDIDLALSPSRLHIGEIVIDGLDSAFRIYENGDTNIGVVLRTAMQDDATADEVQEDAVAEGGTGEGTGTEDSVEFPFAVDRIAITRSTLLFNDRLIVPPVLLRIEDFDGEITGLDSAPESQLAVKATGRVGDHGGANVATAVAPFAPAHDLNADVSFANVEMTAFSPYAGRFAGYEISKGKLFLDLKYTLDGNRIKGENHAVFDQFELGNRVDSEDATSLPVKFALSLLRDRHGRIDISLPIEGDIDAPGFRFGHLIGQTLINLLTRMVTAPFTFIANVFGGGPDMEYAVFEAGSGVIPADERENILPLSNALAERPQLTVEVQGWADPAADGAIMRQRKFEAVLATAIAQGAAAPAALESLYEALFGAGSAASLRAELSVPAQDAPASSAPVPDPAAWEQEWEEALRTRAIAAQEVSDEELIQLAYDRGRQVMDVLVRDGNVAAERIFVRRGEIARADEGTRARLILGAR